MKANIRESGFADHLFEVCNHVVWQSHHVLKLAMSSYLLDLKKRCQAFLSILNSTPDELPIPRYSPDQVHFSLL